MLGDRCSGTYKKTSLMEKKDVIDKLKSSRYGRLRYNQNASYRELLEEMSTRLEQSDSAEESGKEEESSAAATVVEAEGKRKESGRRGWAAARARLAERRWFTNRLTTRFLNLKARLMKQSQQQVAPTSAGPPEYSASTNEKERSGGGLAQPPQTVDSGEVAAAWSSRHANGVYAAPPSSSDEEEEKEEDSEASFELDYDETERSSALPLVSEEEKNGTLVQSEEHDTEPPPLEELFAEVERTRFCAAERIAELPLGVKKTNFEETLMEIGRKLHESGRRLSDEQLLVHADELAALLEGADALLAAAPQRTDNEGTADQRAELQGGGPNTAQTFENLLTNDSTLTACNEDSVEQAASTESASLSSPDDAEIVQVLVDEVAALAPELVGLVTQSSWAFFRQMVKKEEETRQLADVMANDTSGRRYCNSLRRTMNGQVNKIGPKSNVLPIYKFLKSLLSGERVESYDGQSINCSVGATEVCHFFLANSVLKTAGKNIDAVDKFASLLSGLMVEVVGFRATFYSVLYTACPYLLPFYKESAKFERPGADVEVKKLTAQVRLFCYLLVCQPSTSLPRRRPLQHSHQAKQVWRLLAAAANLPPVPVVTALLLNELLTICRPLIFETYGRQYRKLELVLVNNVLPDVCRQSRSGSAIANYERLRKTVESFAEYTVSDR